MFQQQLSRAVVLKGQRQAKLSAPGSLMMGSRKARTQFPVDEEHLAKINAI